MIGIVPISEDRGTPQELLQVRAGECSDDGVDVRRGKDPVLRFVEEVQRSPVPQHLAPRDERRVGQAFVPTPPFPGRGESRPSAASARTAACAARGCLRRISWSWRRSSASSSSRGWARCADRGRFDRLMSACGVSTIARVCAASATHVRPPRAPFAYGQASPRGGRAVPARRSRAVPARRSSGFRVCRSTAPPRGRCPHPCMVPG